MNKTSHQREAVIEGLGYKRGHLGKAYYDNGYEWILSLDKSAADVEQAIKDAKSKDAPKEKEFSRPKAVKASGRKAPKQNTEKRPLDPEMVLKALAKGQKTMRQLRAETKRGPSAINTALKSLGGKVENRKIPREGAYSAQHKVTVWELVA